MGVRHGIVLYPPTYFVSIFEM